MYLKTVVGFITELRSNEQLRYSDSIRNQTLLMPAAGQSGACRIIIIIAGSTRLFEVKVQLTNIRLGTTVERRRLERRRTVR